MYQSVLYSGGKLADLYQELRSVEATPQLVSTFEGAISSLVDDIKTLHEENKKLEDMFNRYVLRSSRSAPTIVITILQVYFFFDNNLLSFIGNCQLLLTT